MGRSNVHAGARTGSYGLEHTESGETSSVASRSLESRATVEQRYISCLNEQMWAYLNKTFDDKPIDFVIFVNLRQADRSWVSL